MFFGRRRTEAAAGPGAASSLDVREGHLPCSERGCVKQTGIPCEYVDRRQRGCETAWCPEHQTPIHGRNYCRRHAGVIRAVGSDPEHLTHLPDIDNRAPSLANWVGKDLDADIKEMLLNCGRGENLIVSKLVPTGTPRDRTWARHWKLVSFNTIDHQVSVTVNENDDTMVHIWADGVIVARGIPPWITARKEGRQLDPAEDSRLRNSYYSGFMNAIRVACGLQARRDGGSALPGVSAVDRFGRYSAQP